LGLEVTEYEPEQFPGLIYCPSEAENVVVLFANGRIVITGSPNLDLAEQTFVLVRNKIEDILTVN
jgi:transcription initiation factor TFIID TATA-box-binding protein